MRCPPRLRFAAALQAAALVAAPALASEDEVIRERARAVLAPFQRELQAALQAGLARGPVEAIDACRLRAPEIAASASTPAARVGRTSHELRHPANAPAPWMEPILAAYRADPSDRAPRVVALEGGRHGYAEPIVMQPPCLVCHGEAIPGPVKARLEEHYPDDRATGFRAGDLRGLFWVELAPSP